MLLQKAHRKEKGGSLTECYFLIGIFSKEIEMKSQCDCDFYFSSILPVDKKEL